MANPWSLVLVLNSTTPQKLKLVLIHLELVLISIITSYLISVLVMMTLQTLTFVLKLITLSYLILVPFVIMRACIGYTRWFVGSLRDYMGLIIFCDLIADFAQHTT